MTTLPGRDGDPGAVVDRNGFHSAVAGGWQSWWCGGTDARARPSSARWPRAHPRAAAVRLCRAPRPGPRELRGDLKSLSSQARPAGDSADPGRAREAVRRAARTLARAGGARVRTSMETVSGGTRLTIHGTGDTTSRGPSDSSR
ncbi:hypothetical protein ACFQ2B_18035 [Streptomyces stramineus]